MNQLTENIRAVTEPNDYQLLSQQFYYLVDKELSLSENDIATKDPRQISNQIINRIPSLISLVNTVGYLRGQDGVFLDFRPPTITFQKTLYEMEDWFESRLAKIIKWVSISTDNQALKEKLAEYYINVRIK